MIYAVVKMYGYVLDRLMCFISLVIV